MKTIIKEIKSDWKKTRVWFAIMVGIFFFFNVWFGWKIGIRENVEEYISGGIYMLYIIWFAQWVYKMK